MEPFVQPTDKQTELLKYIIDFTQEHGYQPTRAEMASHFNVAVNAVNERLKGLARRGIIDLDNAADRAIGLGSIRFKAYVVKGDNGESGDQTEQP